MRIGRLALVGLVGLGLACGENGIEPTVEGSFTTTITGDLQRTLSGRAIFGVTTVSGYDGFVIALEQGTSASLNVDLVLLGRFNTQRPNVGTYDIHEAGCTNCSEDNFDGGYVFQRPDGAAGFYTSESGQLTITRSTADTVAGSCSFSAVNLFDAQEEIEIVGEFTAVPGAIPGVPGG